MNVSRDEIHSTYLLLEYMNTTDPRKLNPGSGAFYRLPDGTEVVWLRHSGGPVSVGWASPGDDLPEWGYYEDLA